MRDAERYVVLLPFWFFVCSPFLADVSKFRQMASMLTFELSQEQDRRYLFDKASKGKTQSAWTLSVAGQITIKKG